MRLSLRDTQLKALGELDETGILPRVDIDADRHVFMSSISVDLSRFEDEILQKLSKFLRDSKVRGTLTMSEDIDMFITLRNTEDKFGIKMRKVEFFKAYLTEALRDSERHRLYRFDPDRNVWFAYYVYGISYYPTVTRDGWTDPEHVIISLSWVELGVDCAETVRFDAQHTVGKTVREALQTQGFHLETPSLHDGYCQAESKFDNLRGEIGLQVLATGIGTNDIDNDRSWWRTSTIVLDKEGPSRMVIDVFKESDEERSSRSRSRGVDRSWWDRETIGDDDREITDEVLPLHPMLCAFHLKKHLRLRVHVDQLEVYQYTPSLGEKLVLPKIHRELVDSLLAFSDEFEDIVSGKGGGATILCTGAPGTGKTLTAEVYAEVVKRPLYTVQCSQLGLTPEDLEAEIQKIFARSYRWGAILLLDEADVYVHQRGSSLTQNAIVGVFLRVLEYYRGVLFLTTNRGDDVDDAVASRCIARIDYSTPSAEDLSRIWEILSETFGVSLESNLIPRLVEAWPHLVGRDVKNLLKLVKIRVFDRVATFADFEAIKQFKPTRDTEMI